MFKIYNALDWGIKRVWRGAQRKEKNKQTEKEYRKSTSVFHFLGSESSPKQEITDISLFILLYIFLCTGSHSQYIFLCPLFYVSDSTLYMLLKPCFCPFCKSPHIRAHILLCAFFPSCAVGHLWMGQYNFNHTLWETCLLLYSCYPEYLPRHCFTCGYLCFRINPYRWKCRGKGWLCW